MNIFLIIIYMFIKWSYMSLPNHIGYWPYNDYRILSMHSNLFQTRVFFSGEGSDLLE